MACLLIRNVNTGVHDALDILIDGDRIAGIGPAIDVPDG